MPDPLPLDSRRARVRRFTFVSAAIAASLGMIAAPCGRSGVERDAPRAPVLDAGSAGAIDGDAGSLDGAARDVDASPERQP